ncbi:MAG TPA: FtsX-like permease family protein, partial [Acidimicrobiales bacterium]|nr:FtsX-like permease family protein [Acidimicrobiales bacterium]
MTGSHARPVRYWLARTLPRRPRGLVAVVLLLGLVGGVALGAIAAARRTQSAFPAYLRASHASDLQVLLYQIGTSVGNGTANHTDIVSSLAHLRDVAHVSTAPYLFLSPTGGHVPPAIADGDVTFVGSEGGAYTLVDRPSVVAGTMADPSDPDEIMASTQAASLLGWHVGQLIRLAAYSDRQVSVASRFPPPRVAPVAHVTVRLVGLVVFANQIAHDDVDRFPTYVVATPALTTRLASSAGFTDYALSLVHGSADVPLVEREILRRLPPFSAYQFHVTSVVAGQVERATRPEAIALAVFGLIAALAALLVGAQSLRREVWSRREESEVVRALGAGRATRVAGMTVGALGAVVLGGVLAIGVAIALSPLAPLGAVRTIEPTPGVSLDGLALGAGAALLVAMLGAVTIGFGVRATRPVRDDSEPARRSRLADGSARAGLPAPAVAGIRFSLAGDRTASGAQVRSVLLASVLAVAVVVATVTFASGLSTLDSHPTLYGWNWSDAILSPNSTDVPPRAGTLLSHDPDVAAWSGFNFANAQIDGTTVPIILSPPHAAVGPALLAGHGVLAPGQIVLGATTLAQLHRRLGQRVVVSYGTKADYPIYVPKTSVTIVGVATMPAIGNPGNLHTSMGIGAVLATGIEPAAFRAALHSPDANLDGPEIDVVRLRSGVSESAGLASLESVARAATTIMQRDPKGGGPPYLVVGPQRPAEIVAYEASGATPAVLALALAAGATAALALALTSSVRRRSRELGLLKTLGFTRRQLASTVAAQSTVVALVGVLVGTPIGVALGRWLWILFARQIGAVPDATVPALQLVGIGVATVVLANV